VKRDARSPEHYRADVRGVPSQILESIREILFEVEPALEEGIAYGMLDYPGLANLAAQKNYVSLYVLSSVLARHKRAFPGLDAGKSCLRFKRLEQVDRPALRALLEDVRKTRQAG